MSVCRLIPIVEPEETAVGRQRFIKYIPAETNAHETVEEMLGAVFSTRSSHLHLGLPICLFSSGFPTKILHNFYSLLFHAFYMICSSLCIGYAKKHSTNIKNIKRAPHTWGIAPEYDQSRYDFSVWSQHKKSSNVDYVWKFCVYIGTIQRICLVSGDFHSDSTLILTITAVK
jgi:hypothetical protein